MEKGNTNVSQKMKIYTFFFKSKKYAEVVHGKKLTRKSKIATSLYLFSARSEACLSCLKKGGKKDQE